MTQFFTIDRANKRIPEVRELLLRLRSQRDELVGLRDRYVDLTAAAETGAASSAASGTGTGQGQTRIELGEARRLMLRIRGIVDQMGATVARIDGWGITLRDIETGLIDFPALVNGRQIWLCWRLGEDDIEWWHELDSGFAGRRRLADLE